MNFIPSKGLTLELGGRSNIIHEDANPETAIPMALQAGFLNNGQACIAGARLLVPEGKLDEVKRLLLTEAATYTVGDPSKADVKIGPLASQRQRFRLRTNSLYQRWRYGPAKKSGSS